MSNIYTCELGGRTLAIETGKLAKQANGAVTVRYGDTMILATAVIGPERPGIDFLPLTVEYEEKHYAIGKIPGNFFRREGRPGERAVLSARLTDRPIRPLFPKYLRSDLQVIITVLSADQVNSPETLGTIGASAALAISQIPWNGPIAAVRIGRLAGEFVINPTLQELERSELDLIVAGSKDAVLMVEAGAKELPEEVMVAAIEYGHRALQPLIALQEQMVREVGKPKVVVEEPPLDQAVLAKVRELAFAGGLKERITAGSKSERNDALDELRDSIVEQLVPPEVEEVLTTQVIRCFEQVEREEMRRMVLEERRRADSRGLENIRPISIEVGVLPRTHGSALFTRGETQSLGIATLGTGRDNQLVDDLTLEETKDFLLHYNFPPFCTGEVKPLRGTSRREVGHGNLARRALEPVLPPKEEFPYTIRVVSEILESNGSSSMATVCSGSLSLMDAGVKIKAPVAGIAMGLVKEQERYVILSDILGSEDHLGDMDFKVAGTRQGVTALQMDIKIAGITAQLMREALEQARRGRQFILDQMDVVLPQARAQLSPYAPRIVSVTIKPDKIGSLIGPGGKNIRSIQDDTGAQIEVQDDGTVYIYSADAAAAEAARQRVEAATAEAEVGKTYLGRVVSITNFGAFLEILPGTEGLLHISRVAPERVERVEDILRIGDKIEVTVIGFNSQGKIDLARPGIEPKRGGPPRSGGPHRPDSGPRGGGGGPRRDRRF